MHNMQGYDNVAADDARGKVIYQMPLSSLFRYAPASGGCRCCFKKDAVHHFPSARLPNEAPVVVLTTTGSSTAMHVHTHVDHSPLRKKRPLQSLHPSLCVEQRALTGAAGI